MITTICAATVSQSSADKNFPISLSDRLPASTCHHPSIRSNTRASLWPLWNAPTCCKSFDDVLACLTSIHRLTTIALALGPQRTRDELIPFITKGMDNEDEVLLALAGELNAAFVEFLGSPEFAHLLLVPLKNLGTVEEMLICDKAAKSLTQIAALLSAQQLEEYYVPAMKRLSVAEWFTSRAVRNSSGICREDLDSRAAIPRFAYLVFVDRYLEWKTSNGWLSPCTGTQSVGRRFTEY
ncbi:uncharacterized protein VP01_2063g7 [Puccinia sorghi]|uniref:Uncharacterized protein n=1 Tax=Puccinia sorghi TaxID=27349 RepID=A0A0L6VAS8_9BASI|nr:uncharacterized protein VP01_2063g7 [Puccinia sorghi]